MIGLHDADLIYRNENVHERVEASDISNITVTLIS